MEKAVENSLFYFPHPNLNFFLSSCVKSRLNFRDIVFNCNFAVAKHVGLCYNSSSCCLKDTNGYKRNRNYCITFFLRVGQRELEMARQKEEYQNPCKFFRFYIFATSIVSCLAKTFSHLYCTSPTNVHKSREANDMV
jgi:hypothetical protein